MNSLDALVESTAGDVECTIRAAMFEQLKRPVHFTSYWNSRIDVYIHQIETALSVLEMKSPRVLLADEVGLGKTIEALLILKEWIVRNEASRVLVVLPSNLSSQWQYEMESKFSLFPIIVDRGNLGEVFSQGNEGLYLVSIDFAKRHLEEFSGHDWDVVLFDEAHHLRRHLRRGNKIESTLKYELGRALSPKTNGLLLLTATPMQLDEFEFYSILLLIDENLFPTYDDFLYYYETLLPRITRALERIRDEAEELDLADLHMLYDRGRRCLDYLELPELSDDCEDLDEIQGHLESLIVFPDFMIRHRKREEFPELPPREVSTIPIVYSDYERGIYEDITRFFREVYGISKATNSPALGLLAVVYQQMLTSSPRALANSLRRRLKGKAYLEESIPGDYEDSVETEALRMLPGVSPLSEAHILHDFVTRLEEMPIDSKLEALVKLVGNVLLTHPDEKILVFTRFLDTQDYLAKTLGKHFDVVTFNGKMDARTKDENVMKFRKSARVMISSEAGGEGRNFQFSHIMVNYDLPWNPVRLEQRIGRIDRIGQQRNVIVYNMAIDGTVEERIFKALADRVFRFESLVGAADTILGNIETDIAKVVLAQDKLLENREYDQFTRTLDAKISKARRATDYFNQLSSFRKAGAERSRATEEALREFPEGELESFIVSFVAGLDGARVRALGKDCYSMFIPANSVLNNRYDVNLEATFSRKVATDEPEVTFLNIDHTFVSNILHTILSPERPSIAFEKNANAIPSAYWCFYGGMDKGYCLVATSNADTKLVSPESAIHGSTYDADRSVSCDDTTIDGLKRYYERARLVAERYFNYPQDGADLVCVRVVNFSSMAEGEAS